MPKEIKFEDLPKKELEFRVRKEDWSKYEILDGKGLVWVRGILTKLYEIDLKDIDPAGPKRKDYMAAHQLVVTAFFDEKVKGKPTPPLPPEQMETGGVSVEFETLEEPFNQYLISGPKERSIRAKAVATSVRYFPKNFNQFGDPVVHVNAQHVVSPTVDAPGEEYSKK